MKYIIAILMTALLLLAGCGETSTINVSADSEITVEPDEAEVWVGISIVKLTAEEAQNEANFVINAIIDGLRYKGIDEKDITTEQLSLYEDKTWEDGKYVNNGWRATQRLSIKTDDLSKVGLIVDVAVQNGANQIQNINFGLSEELEQKYKQEAIAKATEAAKGKAETIAASLDAKLGKIVSVSESNYYYSPRMYAMEATAAKDAVQESANIMPGDVTVTGQISLVYEIK